jgi:hypothetical protein
MTALMTNAHSLSRFFQTDSRALRRPLFFFLKSALDGFLSFGRQ